MRIVDRFRQRGELDMPLVNCKGCSPLHTNCGLSYCDGRVAGPFEEWEHSDGVVDRICGECGAVVAENVARRTVEGLRVEVVNPQPLRQNLHERGNDE